MSMQACSFETKSEILSVINYKLGNDMNCAENREEHGQCVQIDEKRNNNNLEQVHVFRLAAIAVRWRYPGQAERVAGVSEIRSEMPA